MKRNKIIGILFFISLIFPGAFGASVEIGPGYFVWEYAGYNIL